MDGDYWLNKWPTHPVVLTRANAADGYPLPLTPLSEDLVLQFEEAGVRKFYFEGLAVLTPADAPDPYLSAFWGLVYLNADQMAGLGDATPGSSRQGIYQQFLGLDPDPDFRPTKAPLGTTVVAGIKGIGVLPRMLRLASGIEERIREQRRVIVAARPVGGEDALTDAECLAWLGRLDDVHVACWETLITGAGLAGAFFDISRKLLAAVAHDETGDLTNRLHVGLGGNESAEAGRAVRRLAEFATADPALAAALRDRAPVAEVLASAGPAFTTALQQVIDRYGYRAPAELELANSSWRADPTQLLDVVRRELGQVAEDGNAARTRADAEAELRRRLRRPIQRPVNGVIRRSRTLMAVRENAKLPVVLLFDEIRRILEVQASRLVDRGVLPEAGDIHLLLHRELREILAGGDGPGHAELERRRHAYAACLDLALPELVEAGPGYLRPVSDAALTARGVKPPEKLDHLATSLHGIGASPGRVTATARVLLDPDDEFEPGDVLFAHTVDPGWSPVLACAGAVVLDIGGLLSHGAVVARELGIPCVVNVREGTTLAISGRSVTVDGSVGEVTLQA